MPLPAAPASRCLRFQLPDRTSPTVLTGRVTALPKSCRHPPIVPPQSDTSDLCPCAGPPAGPPPLADRSRRKHARLPGIIFALRRVRRRRPVSRLVTGAAAAGRRVRGAPAADAVRGQPRCHVELCGRSQTAVANDASTPIDFRPVSGEQVRHERPVPG